HQQPEDYPAYLRALQRMMRPSGVFAISLFASPESASEGTLREVPNGRLARYFTPVEAEAMLGEAGFSVFATRRVQRERPDWAYLLLLARTPGR
ncbi:hypothetical protein AB0K09_30525, partial [Streptomyces sp. NPDC049577]